MEKQNVWHRASEVPAHIHDAHKDSKRPIFHPLAPRGWSSDPCGPILYKGRYHLFYQHQHASCQWYWGLCWDHVVSDDLVHWKNLPPAVVPTPGGLDADGCFSGTVEIDPELGVPVIMYTGVYLKTNKEAVAAHGLPAPQHDPGTRFVEKQLAAVPADPDDPDLTYWVKLPAPVMSLPPPGLNISCWRDPYCLTRPAAAGGEGDEWVVLLASGIRGVGGAVLRFRSKHFTHGWVFDGILADGNNAILGIRGQDWECPILTKLPTASKAAVTAAIAASTAASPATTAAKQPAPLAAMKPLAAYADITSNSSSSSSSSSSSKSDVYVRPSTPQLKGVARAATTFSSLSSLSGFGGSSASLAAAAVAAAAAAESAADAGIVEESNSSSSSNVAAVLESPAAAAAIAASPAAGTNAVAAGSMLALPLTEPALAAATSAAAAPVTHDDVTLTHPAVNVDAWVDHQTQQQVEDITPAAIADSAAVGTISSQDDITVIILGEDDTESDGKGQHQLQMTSLTASSNAALQELIGSSGSCDKRWWFCMSPDACNNPITWWLGDYDGDRFDIAAADGPHRLDLGTTLYAATLWQDPQGRQLLYGWIQEHRRVPTPPALCDDYSYAGCISTPRVVQLVEGQLWQTPLPEIDNLRTSVCWTAHNLQLRPGNPLLPLQVVSGTHLDINLTLLPPASVTAAAAAAAAAAASTAAAAAAEEPRAGLVFKSWRPCGKGAAVLSFNWVTGVLLFDFDEPFPDAYTPHPDDTPDRRRVGAKLKHYVAGEPLSLRVLLDGSAVEVFTNTGETLTTRMYRGHPPKCVCAGCSPIAATAAATAATAAGGCMSKTASAAEAAATATPPAADIFEDETGISLFAAGAGVTVSQVSVWEMSSCWVTPSCPPPQPPVLRQQQQQQLAATHQADPAAAMMTAATGPADVAAYSPPGVLRKSSSDAAAEAAVYGVPVPAGTASVTDNSQQQQQQQEHHPAGEQATVQEGFLEELSIHAKLPAA